MKIEINTKFDIGDVVWFMNNNVPRSAKIIGIIINQCEIETNFKGQTYRNPGGIFHYHLLGTPSFIYENYAFSSKKELVESLMSEGDKEK